MTKRSAKVVTVGTSKESLGAMKLAAWLRREGWIVDETTTLDPLFDGGCDLYAFSAVYSWRLPRLVELARLACETYRAEVWIGGPAVTFSRRNWLYVYDQTGIRPHHGIDPRFDGEPGKYPMAYFSRGCPAYSPACGTCPVPHMDGSEFTYYPDATPAKFLLDNNLSALPDDYQDHIIRRYREDWKGGKVDANSGFEPHSFTVETLKRWEAFPLACWRFGYDDLTERDQALEMMRLLKAHGYNGERVKVYTLIGNEPIADCLTRIREVIANGCHPWPQRLRPLDWREGPLPCRHDWDEPTLIAIQRFYSIAGLWKRLKPEDYFYQGRYPFRDCLDAA